MSIRKISQGAALGAGTGLVGAPSMNVASSIWATMHRSAQRSGRQASKDEDATVKTARKLAEPVLHRPLTKRETEQGGPAVHYLFGALTGAL